MEKAENCTKKDFIICPTCKMEVSKDFLGQRCPRCNSVIIPKTCEDCKNICK